MKKGWYQLFVILTVFSLILAACGRGEGSGAEESLNGGGGAGGELKMLGDDPPTLDPALSGDTTSAFYIVEVFSGLVTLNHKLQIEPDLAERWEVSSDGKTYTFFLRKNAKFHSGKLVTANDFKYSFERAADPKTQATLADTYLGDIIGVKDKLNGKASVVQGVKVVDDNTLQIEIDAPKSYFLAKMTYPTSFVLDKENVESSKEWTKKPNGTGPFKLKEWRIGERIILEKNPAYYMEPAKLDKVTLLLAGGSGSTMYENNEIDVTGVPIDELEAIAAPSHKFNKQLLVASDLSVGYVGFTNNVAPFDDVKVRQAFVHAVDRDKITKVIYKDTRQKANGILPPGMPGYNPNLKGLEYDPEKAKRLLKESKYASGLPPITLNIPGSSSTPPPFAEVLQQDWKNVLGVDVKIQQIEWATFLEDLKKHKFQSFMIGWVADYPDPQDFLDILFHSKSLENNPLYANPEVDQVLETARVERDVEKRMKLYQQVEQTIVNEAPWLPLWYGKNYLLVKPYVQGKEYLAAPMVIPSLKFVSIEK
ncbi:MAG: ABC-type dipeptide/oligopeptide/nickel transport system, periplasmic component [Dehalococcoidia bacterium]|nr:ABC-type dipeptide/oligopeptide/nickel transport system, periplasmic component [Dehalococcoidia bacterium]